MRGPREEGERFSVVEAATVGVLLAAIGLVLLISQLTSRTLDASRRWDSALDRISVNVSQSHVWREESLSGDRSIDLASQVFGRPIEARALTGALLRGGASAAGTLTPVRGTDLQQSIRGLQKRLVALDAAAKERISSSLDQSPGGQSDQRFDTLFRGSLQEAGSVSTLIRAQDRSDRNSLDRLYFVVLGLLVILFAALVLIVRGHVHALRRVGRTPRAILDSAAEGIYGVDREGRIVFVNQAVERITGWQPGDIIGRTAHEHLHRTSPDPPEQPSSQSAVLATLADRTPRTVTGELAWRRNGSSFPVDYTVAPVLDAGESAAATVVFTDAIERLAAEEQLRFLATMIP